MTPRRIWIQTSEVEPKMGVTQTSCSNPWTRLMTQEGTQRRRRAAIMKSCSMESKAFAVSRNSR